MNKNNFNSLRPEYKRTDLGKGTRGKYFKSYQKGTNLVLLSPDVAKAFPNEEAVNNALRSLINRDKRTPKKETISRLHIEKSTEHKEEDWIKTETKPFFAGEP